MRLAVVLFLLGTPMAIGQGCPTPDPDAVCEQSYDPVTCDGCAFPNECVAMAAGAENCVASCDEPDPTACTYEYAPVACGGFVWCIYDNLCQALSAGKQEIDCVRDCPSIPEGEPVACTADYNPYFCGGCFYVNECEKDAAWVGNGLPDSSCTAIADLVPAEETCPTVPDGTACTLEDAPVICDNDCTYTNDCLASAAGAQGCSPVCSPPSADSFCTLEFDPVICPNSCVYSNACLAAAAGIDETTCSPVCPEPDTGVVCTDDYAPVYCQGCEYSNECVANAAGFTVTDDCVTVTTSVTLVSAGTCPTVPDGTMCTLNFDPVTCDNDCTYDNDCLAQAAGATGCSGSCPIPANDTVCTADFAPVACGGFQWCLYDNLCLALAAGQDEIDCTRDCPTDTSGVTACPAIYDPVLCGGCFYANSCVATAAWVTSAGLPESSCIAISTVGSAQECPTVDEPVACTLDYRPQTCDNGCEYVNTCMADAAGATGCADSCPPSAGQIMCTREYEPVVCAGGCVYNNECLAQDAGIDTATCGPVCPDPSQANTTTVCTTEFDPVYCKGCEFSNECVAESVGFDIAADCQSIATPVTRETATADSPTDAPATDDPTDAPTTSGATASMVYAATVLAALMTVAPFLA